MVGNSFNFSQWMDEKLASLSQLAMQGATEQVEFIPSVIHISSAAQALCALLNGQGGEVILGMTTLGQLVGQDVTESTLGHIGTVLRKIQPATHVPVQRIPVPGTSNEVIILQALPFTDRQPYTYEGVPYQRAGATTYVMPQQRYEKKLLTRSIWNEKWECTVDEALQIEKLDHAEIFRTIRTSLDIQRADFIDKNVDSVLERLGLLRAGQLVRAAAILFAGAEEQYYPQQQMRLTYCNIKAGEQHSTSSLVRGNVFQLLREMLEFKKIQGIMCISDIVAQTALLRAVCQRDYEDASTVLTVSFGDGTLTISGPGLETGVSVAQETTMHNEVNLRNSLIAEVLFRRGLWN